MSSEKICTANFKNFNPKSIAKKDKVFLGISVRRQPAHKGKKMKAIKQLFKQQNLRPIYIIGDEVQRYNLAIESDGNPDNHAQSAIGYGDEWLAEHGSNLAEEQKVRFSDYLARSESQEIINILKEYYQEADKFKQAVDDFANSYLTRLQGNGKNKLTKVKVSDEMAKNLAVAFAIEELGIIFSLFERNTPSYFIYPDKEFEAFRLAKIKLEKNVTWLTIEFKNRSITCEKNKSYSGNLDDAKTSGSSSEEETNSPPVEDKSFTMEEKFLKEMLKKYEDNPIMQAQMAGAFFGSRENAKLVRTGNSVRPSDLEEPEYSPYKSNIVASPSFFKNLSTANENKMHNDLKKKPNKLSQSERVKAH